MPFQPATNVVEVRLQALLNGQQVENVFHVGTESAPTPGDVHSIAQIVQDWAGGAYAGVQSVDVTYTQVVATDLTVAGGVQSTIAFDPPQSGEISQHVKTNQDTFAVSFKTNRSGRSYRGRAYVLGIATGAYEDPNTLSSDAVSSLLGAFQTLATALAVEDYTLGVLSRFTGGAPRPIALLEPVTSITASDRTVDSQRRRLPHRGA